MFEIAIVSAPKIIENSPSNAIDDPSQKSHHGKPINQNTLHNSLSKGELASQGNQSRHPSLELTVDLV